MTWPTDSHIIVSVNGDSTEEEIDVMAEALFEWSVRKFALFDDRDVKRVTESGER